MGVTYVKVKRDSKEYGLLEEARRRWHASRLTGNDFEVSIALLMAFPPVDKFGEPTGPALMLHGIPAAGITRNISYKWRVHGIEDVEISIDAIQWGEMTKAEKLALLDHELTHIEPIFKDGAIEKDDLGRPKIGMRHHDFNHGWFEEVAERHGQNSVEVQQARQFANQAGQIFLNFGDEGQE